MTFEILTGAAAEAVASESITGGETGFARRRVSEAQVLEAAQLMGRMFKGNRRASLTFAESLASGDFRASAFEVLDREMLERYQDMEPVWPQYAARTTVRDFRPKRMVDLLGGRGALAAVPERTEYPARSVQKALYNLSVGKYGGRFQITWESIINDELGEIQELPNNLAVAAADTESRVAAGLLTDGTGANGSYFNSTAQGKTYDLQGNASGGSTNLLASNPTLTIDNLTAALQTIATRRDPDGRPIMVKGYVLVVPQALEIVAQKILATIELRVTVGANESLLRNWVAGRVKLVVEPWLDVLDTATDHATSWWLLPDPQSSRPALHVGFLRGHETPDLRVKADGGNRIGGGQVDPLEGSFDVDDVQYRVRHVVGGVGTDMIATAFSSGAGS